MASSKLIPLIQIGPSKGLDSSSAGDFVEQGDGAVVSAITTSRVIGALSIPKGREQLANFNDSALSVNAIVPVALSSGEQLYLVSLTEGGGIKRAAWYNPQTNLITLVSGSIAFDQAIQFYNIVYANSGQQFSPYYLTNAFAWQYPAPPSLTSTDGPAYIVTPIAGTLPAGTYYYAFTHVVTGPGGNPIFLQETSPTGADALTDSPNLYPYTVTSTGTTGAFITTGPGISFWGTNPDGSTYITNIYRQSSNVPVWTLLGSVGPPFSTSYTDNATDESIGANQQLDLSQDPPPTVNILNGTEGQNYCAIFPHQERIFCFALVAGPENSYRPQPELWYSNLGTPWVFDSSAQEDGGQVLVVGGGEVPQPPESTIVSQTYGGYGDTPVGGVSCGGTAILFKTRTAWLLLGNDPVSYFIQPLFPIGCVSKLSIINGDGIVYWLAPQGAYMWAGIGAAPQYIGLKVKNTINAIPVSDQINAVSMFSEQTWYLSFPATGITLAYYTVTGNWRELPYATTAAASVPANPNTPLVSGSFSTYSGKFGEIVAARSSGQYIDNWLASEQDLTLAQTGTWTSPLTCSTMPHVQKTYDYITVLAPYQTGSVTVTLTIDPGSYLPKVFTYTFNLAATDSQEECRHICRVSPDLRGYMAQLQVQVSNTATSTGPVVVYRVDVWGTLDRTLVVPT